MPPGEDGGTVVHMDPETPGDVCRASSAEPCVRHAHTGRPFPGRVVGGWAKTGMVGNTRKQGQGQQRNRGQRQRREDSQNLSV